MTGLQNDITCSSCRFLIDASLTCQVYGKRLEPGDEFIKHPCKGFDIADIFTAYQTMPQLLACVEGENKKALWYLWEILDGRSLNKRDYVLSILSNNPLEKIQNYLKII